MWCRMRFCQPHGAVAEGWLCVTDERLTFTPFEPLELDLQLSSPSNNTQDERQIPLGEWFGQGGWVAPSDHVIAM